MIIGREAMHSILCRQPRMVDRLPGLRPGAAAVSRRWALSTGNRLISFAFWCLWRERFSLDLEHSAGGHRLFRRQHELIAATLRAFAVHHNDSEISINSHAHGQVLRFFISPIVNNTPPKGGRC